MRTEVENKREIAYNVVLKILWLVHKSHMGILRIRAFQNLLRWRPLKYRGAHDLS